ncbi:protein ATP6V1FNB-like [Stegodyphus dumicola]|uniref:protein ATP6V1FNB-like n=1 Tax=Stegodyphus dumicola TaxID=202533 RepID=UPI0015B0A436|nr:protein ATP6V1FNB-like [Stegodyphus dumicola]
MAREKMFEPAFQKAFTEAIHKENKIRVQWHLVHGRKPTEESCLWDDEPDDDDEDFVPEKETEPVSEASSEIKRQLPPILEDETPEIVELPKPMKPVPTKVKRRLYKGLSHYGAGRADYLRERYKELPEQKFYFPICSSWEYGWTYGQEHVLEGPTHGRRQIIRTSFFRPNDPQLKPRD